MPEFNPSRIGIVGYGEVGRIFGAGLRDQSPQPSVGAWDRKLTDPSQQADGRHGRRVRISFG